MPAVTVTVTVMGPPFAEAESPEGSWELPICGRIERRGLAEKTPKDPVLAQSVELPEFSGKFFLGKLWESALTTELLSDTNRPWDE